jgi:ferritin
MEQKPTVLTRTLKKDGGEASVKAPPIAGKNPLLSDHCVGYLNYRVQQEEYSARIYLSMALWLSNEGYLGAGKLWRNYSDEEMKHADIARNYLLAMGVQPITAKLESPTQVFTGLPDIIKQSYDHEIEVTTQIKDMATEALKKADHMLYELCLGYLKEQVEEHDKMQNWMDRLSAFGTDKVAIRLLDNEMAG